MNYETKGGLSKIDQLIKEYLVFRGFHNTLKCLEAERRHDRNQGFQSVRIVERLFHHIKSFEYPKFLEFWEYLDYTFFTKYPPGRSSVKRLGNALKKYYVVNTILKGKKDKLRTFFERYGNELAKEPEWRDWFVIPFLKNPENHEVLEPYFNEQWAEMLTVSLQNFISTAVLAVEKPKLVTLEKDIRDKNLQMQKIVDRLQKQNEVLKSNLNQANIYIHNVHVKYRIPNPKDGKIPSQPIGDPKSHSRVRKSSSKMRDGSIVDHHLGGSGGPSSLLKTSTIRPSKTSSPTKSSQRSIPSEIMSELGGGDHVISPSSSSPSSTTPKDLSMKNASSINDSTNSQSKCSSVFIKRIYAGHKDNITSCVFSPVEGRYLATSSLDETVRIWSVASDVGRGNRLSAIDLGSQVLSLAWKKKSEKYLISGSNDGFLRLLDVGRKKVVSEVFVDQHFTHLNSLSCSPIDNICIICCQQPNNNRLGRLYGYSLEKEEIEYFNRYPLETTVAETCNFNNNGKLFAIGGRDGTIRIYDTLQKKEIMKWQAHHSNSSVTNVHFMDKSIVSVGEDRNIHEWDMYIKGLAHSSVSIPKNKSFQVNYKPRISFCSAIKNNTFVLNSPGCIFQKFNQKFMPTHRLLNPNSINHQSGKKSYNHDHIGNVQMVAVDWSPNGELIAGGEKEICLFQTTFDDFSDL